MSCDQSKDNAFVASVGIITTFTPGFSFGPLVGPDQVVAGVLRAMVSLMACWTTGSVELHDELGCHATLEPGDAEAEADATDVADGAADGVIAGGAVGDGLAVPLEHAPTASAAATAMVSTRGTLTLASS